MKTRLMISLLFTLVAPLSLHATVADVATNALYTGAGYATMHYCKQLGKEITDKILYVPKGTLNGVLAQDFKFILNAATKGALTKGIAPLFFTIKFPQIPQSKETAAGNLFDTANKFPSFVEFAIDNMKFVGEEMQNLALAKNEIKDIALLSEDSSFIPTIAASTLNDVATYFYNTAIAITREPVSAAIAATYLFASWRVCMFTRNTGEAWRSTLGDGKGGQPAIMPFLAKGHDSGFDKVVQTTIGMLFSSALQTYIVVPLMDKGYESVGLNNSKTTKLNQLAYRAGNKWPFAYDALDAIYKSHLGTAAVATASAIFTYVQIRLNPTNRPKVKSQ